MAYEQTSNDCWKAPITSSVAAYDYAPCGDLILAIINTASSILHSPFSILHSYAYDALGRPFTRATQDISMTPTLSAFGYNPRGEVVSASIGANLYAHSYDGIGNHTLFAANAMTNTYSANNLNQYSSILCASVPLCELSYDLDGNLLSDGVWSYAYDAENRLASVSSNGFAIATFTYDAQGRRVQKIVSHGGTEAQRFDYLYDGWLLVRETATGISTDYVWGKDISGTIGGAGGVGGLLYEERGGDIYVPFYDNNGNITRYCDASGNVVASYTYDAFGNIVAQSGQMADAFAHRFSTKYFDTETGLYYYGYRYYSPPFMRWLNRDPIGENGGRNLYAMCGNNVLEHHDAYGKIPFKFSDASGVSDSFFQVESITVKYKKAWFRNFGTGGARSFELIKIQPGDLIDVKRPGCASLMSIGYTLVPARGLSSLNTPDKTQDDYSPWLGEQIKTSSTFRNRFRFQPVIVFTLKDGNGHEKKSKTDYLWEVWNNMNGEYAYSTTSEFSLFDGSQGDNLQVQLFLHTIRYTEQQVANFGLNPDYDYFRSYIHDYILN